jgi:hypothetical protein
MYKESQNTQIGISFRGSTVDWWDRYHATPLQLRTLLFSAHPLGSILYLYKSVIQSQISISKRVGCKCDITQTDIKTCSFFITCFSIHCFKNQHYYFTKGRHHLKISMEIVFKNAFVPFRKHSVLIIKNRLKAV